MVHNLLNGPMTALLASAPFGIIIDVALVLIFALFAFINLKKGFAKQVLGLLVTIGSILVAYFFSGKILAFVDKQFAVTEKLAGVLLGAMGENAALSASCDPANLSAAIASMGLPTFIANFADKVLAGLTTVGYETIGQFLSHILSHYILVAVAFIVTWILARIVLSFVKKLLAKVFKLPGLNMIDKLLGFALGAIKGIIVIYLLLYVIEIIPSSVEQISFLKDGISSSVVGGLLKEHNLVSMAFTWILENIKF